jgi:hypothetical protein
MKSFENLTSVQEAASRLKISEELVMKFIKNGIVKAIVKRSNTKLTQYNLRRLNQAIRLHEQCLPSEIIEYKLNN